MSARRTVAAVAALTAVLTQSLLAGCSGILGITELDAPTPGDDAGADALADTGAGPGADGAAPIDAAPDGAANPLLKRSCSADGWCWVNPTPSANELTAVWGPSTDDLWAVGAHGTVVHYQAGTFTKVGVPTTRDLNGIWGTAANDFWVVGYGIILHYDKGTWRAQPTETAFSDVRGLGPNDIYAGGWSLQHYDGNAWSNISTPSGFQMYGISPTAHGDLWMSGASGGDAAVAHYHDPPADGGSPWVVTNPGFANGVNSVWAPSADEAWAVGGGGTIAHYAANAWSIVNAVGSSLESVTGTSATDIWAVGVGSAHYDGKTWASIDTHSHYLNSVFTPAPGDAWAVGVYGDFVHFSNGAWTSAVRGTQRTLAAIAGTSDDDVWIIGERATVLHWDGKELASNDLGGNIDDTLTALYVAPSGEVWAAGTGGLAAHRSPGGDLARGSISATHTIWSMWGSAANDIWAVGEGGEIRHYDGTNWTTATSPTTSALYSVRGVSATEVWAVGEKGTILQLTPSGWTIVPSESGADGGLTEDLYAVYGVAPGEFWASGYGPTTLRLVNGVWRKGPDIGFSAYSFWGTGPKDIWAVGRASYSVAHFDGTAWTLEDTGAMPWLNSLWGTPSGAIWAAGEGGTLLHHAP